jgi:hypothetical protein
LWVGSGSDSKKRINRIKRWILKNYKGEVGLNKTNVEYLNKSLNLDNS